jgi:hypothetical protein
VRRNTEIYFICFLCKFGRGEEVVEAAGWVMISLMCTTSNGTCSYNIRDRWVNPRRLNMIAKRQRWLQIRFPRARYFDNKYHFEGAVEEVAAFNVLRRLVDD